MTLRSMLLVLAALPLAGCATAPQVASQAIEPPREFPAEARREPAADARASELVGYFAAIARAGVGEQKRELAQSAVAFARGATPHARLKLGGLYAQPVAALRDDARALSLLEPLAANGAPATDRPLADLAALLYTQVAERQRMEKAEARKQEALREQIEAMKSIERSILRRAERQRSSMDSKQ